MSSSEQARPHNLHIVHSPELTEAEKALDAGNVEEFEQQVFVHIANRISPRQIDPKDSYPGFFSQAMYYKSGKKADSQVGWPHFSPLAESISNLKKSGIIKLWRNKKRGKPKNQNRK